MSGRTPGTRWDMSVSTADGPLVGCVVAGIVAWECPVETQTSRMATDRIPARTDCLSFITPFSRVGGSFYLCVLRPAKRLDRGTVDSPGAWVKRPAQP